MLFFNSIQVDSVIKHTINSTQVAKLIETTSQRLPPSSTAAAPVSRLGPVVRKVDSAVHQIVTFSGVIQGRLIYFKLL